MQHTTKSKLTLFAQNAQAIRKEFPWQHALTKRMAALLYALDDRPIDCESIRRCHALIKQNTGAFSTFRGNMVLSVAALLSLSGNPERQLAESLKVYDLLKGARLRASDFLVIAAYEIAAQAESYNYDKVVARTRAFYDGMKSRHFFRTGHDDYIFAAMLGLTELDITEAVERIATLQARLQGEFRSKNSVQTLAQVLSLGSSDDAVACRVLNLRDALRAQKIKLDRSYTLPSLGVLALLPVEIDTIVRDIGEAQTYLRTQKGFGAWSVSSQELLLFATAAVTGEYAAGVKDGAITAVLSTSISNIIIAQQAAMIAAISASTAAAAASSS